MSVYKGVWGNNPIPLFVVLQGGLYMGQGVIPNDWLGEYCCYSVMWPNSPQWLAVLRGVLVLPATGRFWDEHTGTITEAQAVIVDTFDTNLHIEEVLMSCNEDIANALLAIANALTPVGSGQSSSNCCNDIQVIIDSSIQNTITQPIGGNSIPMYGSQPPLGITPGEFPEGYDNLEEYDVDKCRKATGIVQGVIQGLRNLSLITVFNASALGGLILLAIPGVIAFPPAAIPVAIGAIIVLSVAMSTFSSAADYIEANQEDWVCALYEGDNASNVLGAIADLIDVMVSFLSVSSVVGIAIKTILLVMFSSNTINQLFSATSQGYFPEADCTCVPECEDPQEITWEFPTGTNGWTYSQLSGGDLPDGGWYDPFDTLYVNVDSNITSSAVQLWTSPEGCYIGDKFQVSLSAQASPAGMSAKGIVHYTDDTEDEHVFATSFNTLATFYDMDVNPDKQVVWVAIEFTYSGLAPGFSFSWWLNTISVFFTA